MLRQDIDFYDEFHRDTFRGEGALKVRERQSLLRSLLVGTEGRLLVVGCGGADEMEVVPEGISAVGIDISYTAVLKSRDSAPQYDYVVADAAYLPFRSGTTQGILCSEVIEHVREADRAFKEFSRVESKGGMLVITTPNWLSFYGLARVLGRLLLRRDFTSDDQPYDRWSTKKSLEAQLLRARYTPQQWLGFWFFPPFGKGKYRVPDSLLTPLLRSLMRFDRFLRPHLPTIGHCVCVVARKLDSDE